MKTWHLELCFVAIVLGTTAFLSGAGWLGYVGSGAVLLSFAHIQVSDRMAEVAAETQALAIDGVRAQTSGDIAARYAWQTTKHSAECHRWSMRYLVGKEALWLVYFVALGAWAPIVGVVMFLVYPYWRIWWRKN